MNHTNELPWKETMVLREALVAALEADNEPAIDLALRNLGYQEGEAGLRLFCLHLERSELAAWEELEVLRAVNKAAKQQPAVRPFREPFLLAAFEASIFRRERTMLSARHAYRLYGDEVRALLPANGEGIQAIVPELVDFDAALGQAVANDPDKAHVVRVRPTMDSEVYAQGAVGPLHISQAVARQSALFKEAKLRAAREGRELVIMPNTGSRDPEAEWQRRERQAWRGVAHLLVFAAIWGWLVGITEWPACLVVCLLGAFPVIGLLSAGDRQRRRLAEAAHSCGYKDSAEGWEYNRLSLDEDRLYGRAK